MNRENPVEMLRVVASRRVQAAWLRVVAAVIVVAAGITWFWVTFAGTLALVGYVVAIILAYLVVSSQMRNLSHARARVRSLVPVLLLMCLAVSRGAAAQELNPYNCPQLRTIEMTRQQIEVLRTQREAGIDRLPTARHQQLANESLYRWYWARLARLEDQQRQAEQYCRAAQIRSEAGITRMSPLPESYPYPTDPFSGYPSQAEPPMYPYRGGWTYSPYANQTRVYPPYRSPRGGWIYDPGAPPVYPYDPFRPGWQR